MSAAVVFLMNEKFIRCFINPFYESRASKNLQKIFDVIYEIGNFIALWEAKDVMHQNYYS